MAQRGSVRVSITGDADGLRREVGKADSQLNRLSRSGGKAMRGLGRSATLGGAALAAGLGAGLTASAKAAIEAEKSQARLQAQLKASGISWDRHRDQIDATIQKHSQLSGLDDEDLQDSFTNIVRVTGDVNEALKLNALAADFARAKHMDVAKAGELVGKVAGGNVGILGRYGIQLKDNATSEEAIATLQQKFAGQAKAYGDTTAGSMDRMKVAGENLAETVGASLAPGISKAAGAVSNFITEMQTGTGTGGQFAAAMRRAFTTVKDAVGTAVTAIRGYIKSHRDDINSAIQAAVNVGKAIKAVFEGIVLPIAKRVWPAVQGYVKGAMTVISGVIKVVTAILTGDFKRAWEGAKNIVSGAVKVILNVVRGMTAPFREVASIAGRAIKGTIGGAFEALKKVVSTVIGFIVGAIAKFLRGVADMADVAGKLPFVGSKFRGVADAARGAADKIEGVKRELDGVPGKAIKVQPLIDRFKTLGLRIKDARWFAERFATALRDINSVPKLKPLSDLPSGDPRTAAEKWMAAQGIGVAGPVSGTNKWANIIARQFGLRITSGYRTPEHNAAVGGVPNSQHTHGSPSNPGAIDLVGPSSAMYAAAQWARTHIPGISQVLVHDAGSGLHLHLGFFKRGGTVPGQGDGDKIPALLEPGEFVVNKKAAKPHMRMLQALNSSIPRMAFGGPVGSSVQALKNAGANAEEQKILTAIAMAESGGRFVPGDGGASITPYQIHQPSWAAKARQLGYSMSTWEGAAKMALYIKRTSGYDQWTMFNNGGYSKHLARAAKAVDYFSKRSASGQPGAGAAPGPHKPPGAPAPPPHGAFGGTKPGKPGKGGGISQPASPSLTELLTPQELAGLDWLDLAAAQAEGTSSPGDDLWVAQRALLFWQQVQKRIGNKAPASVRAEIQRNVNQAASNLETLKQGLNVSPGLVASPFGDLLGTDADAAEAVPAGPSSNDLARQEQADRRAFIASRAAALSSLYRSVGAASGDLRGGLNITVQSLVPTDSSALRLLGDTVVGAIGMTQGAVTAPRVQVG